MSKSRVGSSMWGLVIDLFALPVCWALKEPQMIQDQRGSGVTPGRPTFCGVCHYPDLWALPWDKGVFVICNQRRKAFSRFCCLSSSRQASISSKVKKNKTKTQPFKYSAQSILLRYRPINNTSEIAFKNPPVRLNKSQQRLHCEVSKDATDEHKRFLCYNKYVISKCRKAKKQISH